MTAIRQMEIDDIGTVAALDAAIFPDPWSETGLFTYLIREDTVFLVAEEGGTVAGYCGAQSAANEADIITMAVAEEKRGRGIGHQLLDTLIKRLKERGAACVFLEVRAGNRPAQRLYEHYGFARIGIRKDYYSDPREDAVTMKYMERK